MDKTKKWIEIEFGDELWEQKDLQLRLLVRELIKAYEQSLGRNRVVEIIGDEIRPKIVDPEQFRKEMEATDE